MNFKVGDKVKFLDEEGGGVIASIGKDNRVYVTIDDGFDIPTLPSKIIKVESEGESTSREKETREDRELRERNQKIREQSTQFYMPVELEPAIYMVFVAEPEKPLMAGKLEVYLINNTSYHTHYAFYLQREKSPVLQKHAEMGAGQREFMGMINPEEVEEWNSGMIQILFLSDKGPAPEPVSDAFKIRPKRFYLEENYKLYPGWNSRAFAVKLVFPGQAASVKESYKEEQKGKPASEKKIVSRSSIIDKHVTGEREATLDLHIENLVDDYARMNSMEILNTQLSYYRRVLESALINGIQRLIIIHGVGAGILKAEIRRELEEYDYIEVHDAPIAEYGVGASIARIYQQ